MSISTSTSRRRSPLALVSRTIIYILALILAVLWFIPIWITLTTASKTAQDFFHNPFWTLPLRFNLLENIATAWNSASLGQGFINSLIYGVLGATLAVLIAAIASYGLVVLKIRASFLWFLVIFSGTLFPYQIYIVPLYQMYSNIGLYDTQIGVLIFYVAVCIPFCTLVLRSYFSTIPEEIVSAARLDGSSEFRIFCQMYLPLSVSALLVLFLFQFTWIWNDLLFGLVLSNSPEVRPVMASLSSLMGVYAGTSFTVVLAGALVASAPTLIIFLGLQKYFMEGLTIVAKPR